MRVALYDSSITNSVPRDYEKIKNTSFEDVIKGLLDYVKKHGPITEIAVSSFGPIVLDRRHPDYGKLVSVPGDSKASWKYKSLTAMLAKELSISLDKTFLNTDVTGAALGEMRFGNHNVKTGTLVYVTIGTGVGVGAVVDGRPIKGRLHPEGGHVLVLKDERDEKLYPNFKGNCNFHKQCIENMISNHSLAERFNISIDDLPKIGDAEPIWDIIGYYLGQLCLSITYMLSPHCIVIGGGIMKRESILPSTRKNFAALNKNYVKIADVDAYIRHTDVEENAIYGAAVYSD